MCGIAGIADFRPGQSIDCGLLEQMTRRLSHRGPDALSTWHSQEAGIGLGSARLIVVDPAGGGQPMVRRRAGRTWAVTYNGELYNAAELRRTLRSLGHEIQTRSDTEILLTAYIEWGAGCLDRLDGIFAFALCDVEERALFLARDRLGVKPLFYCFKHGRLLFASEIKALLEHPDVSPEVGAEGLAELLLNFPVRTPGRGIFRGVDELLPGHWLKLSPQGLCCRRYWQLPVWRHEDSEKETIRRTRELLESAIESQLIADVPVCTLLSGGLDSSTVTALAAAAGKRSHRASLTAYTVDFTENNQHFVADAIYSGRDGPFARDLASHVGARHRLVWITTGEVWQAYGDSLVARDLPTNGDLDAALYLLCKSLKEEATVALSGEGSDEVFGGYWGWAMKDGKAPMAPGRFPWMNMPDALLRPEILDLIRPREYRERLYEEALAETPEFPEEPPEERAIRQTLYCLQTRFLHTLLERQDRMSMAAGVEVRVPFCDHRLVEYVWNVPWRMKAGGGAEKGLLRRAMADVLPPAICWREKSRFPSSHDPLLADTLGAMLTLSFEADTPLFQVFDREGVSRLVAQRRQTGTMLLSFLVQFDSWMQRYGIRLV